MSAQVEEEREQSPWLWLGVAAGVVLGAAAAVWLVRYRDPSRSMGRLLRRCHERIADIESSLAALHSSLQGSTL